MSSIDRPNLCRCAIIKIIPVQLIQILISDIVIFILSNQVEWADTSSVHHTRPDNVILLDLKFPWYHLFMALKCVCNSV